MSHPLIDHTMTTKLIDLSFIIILGSVDSQGCFNECKKVGVRDYSNTHRASDNKGVAINSKI